MDNSLTSIIVCANYSKFLDLYFKYNTRFLNIIVVTDKNDTSTIDVCKQNKCVVFISNSLFINGMLNRALAYNTVLPYLKGWVALMDVDTILPEEFGKFWQENNNKLDIESFYGMRRIICPSLKDFELAYNNHQTNVIIPNTYCPYGIGYGFFQLFHVESSTFKKNSSYPNILGVAEGDHIWRNKWGATINGDREYTGLLKELPMKCFHLGEPNINNSKFFN